MPAASSSISLTTRDQKILEMIYFYDTCSIDHLTARFFPQNLDRISLYGRKVACYRRIAELREAGYLETYRLGSTTGIGSGKMLISLGPKGRKILSGYLATKSELRRQKEASIPAIRDHHLAICDFRLALELSIDPYSFIYLEWESERDLKRNPIRIKNPIKSGSSKTLSLVPDLGLTVRLSHQAKQSFRLEVESDPLRRPKVIQEKMAGYLTASREDPVDCPTFTLWVVPSFKAQQMLCTWALELSRSLSADPSIFWITTRENISTQLILYPIWQVAGVQGYRALIPNLPTQFSQAFKSQELSQPAYGFIYN